MKYCRIKLAKTNYTAMSPTNCRYIVHEDMFTEMFEIYSKYCEHKQFSSVMPLFEQQFRDVSTEIIGYFSNRKQFAWDYANPKLRLGIESLKNECAKYKARGYKYLYLGSADEYKSQIDGFEILGKL